MEASNIGAHSVDLFWTGVPMSWQSYVDLYQSIIWKKMEVIIPNGCLD